MSEDEKAQKFLGAMRQADAHLREFDATRERAVAIFERAGAPLPNMGRERAFALAHYIASVGVLPITNGHILQLQQADPTELAFVLMSIFFDFGYLQAVDDIHQEKLAV